MEDCLSRGSGAILTERATMSDGVHPGTNAGAASEDRPPTADTSAPPPTGLTWQTTGTLPPGPAIPAAAAALPEQFGRYRIVKLLGRGGMCTVFLSHGTQIDRPVALKRPHADQ